MIFLIMKNNFTELKIYHDSLLQVTWYLTLMDNEISRQTLFLIEQKLFSH